jgi:beta-glucosidase
MNLKISFPLRAMASCIICATLSSAGAEAQTPTTDAIYRNPHLPIDKRVDDLISRMTLEEKISQLGHTADAVPRLEIPEYNWWNEGLHGVARAGVATVFPQAIGLAATFDEPLIHKDAEVISTEFRAKYNMSLGKDGSSQWYKGLTAWSPNINIFRDPRWGRGQETYGEDPYLTSRLGVAFVRGLQGDDPKYTKVVATPKHFAVHSGPEATRHEVDVTVSRHDLEDTYLPAFRATVMEGKASSVMCAYNSLDGQPACANTTLLQEHLRHDWGFQGYVVSDCAAIADIYQHHHFAKTMEEGVAAAFKTGTDLICGEPPQDRVKYERDALLNAVHQGLLSEEEINTALRRLFTARFRLGVFDPPSSVPWSKLGAAQNDTPAHRQFALTTARESLVLLKNQGSFLPLKRTYAKIAVIGPDADSLDALVGNYNGTPSHPVTVLSGIRKRFSQSKITYVQGTGLISPVTRPIPGVMLYTDESRSSHGLKGEYFSNTKLEGSPAMARIDASVDFAWGFNGVSPQLAKNFSIRWTGIFIPNETVTYLVGFTGQDGYRLWLDDKLIADDWSAHRPATTLTREISLEKDHPYKIKIEYFQTVRGAEARLIWGVPGREEQEAVKAAREADLVIVVMGLSARIEGEEMKIHADGFAAGDRTNINLPAPEEKLLQNVFAAGKPTILVLMNGSALAVNWADEHLPAILEAWYPGEAGAQLSQRRLGEISVLLAGCQSLSINLWTSFLPLKTTLWRIAPIDTLTQSHSILLDMASVIPASAIAICMWTRKA